MTKKRDPITTSSEWTFDLLDAYIKEVERVAKDYMKLDHYPNQIEVISAEQMLDLYSSVGLPISYGHWSYGKEFIHNAKAYEHGRMGLAYEIVSNTSPCLVYCMEENTMSMMVLVMAHAGIGHNHFFKNNYLFNQWTDATSIVDYLLFAKHYVEQCEEKYGIDEVEEVLDACHALQNYGVDRYKRPSKISMVKEQQRQKERNAYLQTQLDDIWRTIPAEEQKVAKEGEEIYPPEPQENILYFLEKNAPNLPEWKREIIRIVRKIAQYFYPQRLTKVANEGFASFTHYQIMHRLHEEGLINDGFLLEFLASHTGVVSQLPFDHKYYSGLNPYALGYAIFNDIKRICEDPTDEDKRWFPNLIGQDWRDAVKFAAKNFKDDSFILQYLSPKVIRDLHLFSIKDINISPVYEITAIHNDEGYKKIRSTLSKQYDSTAHEPSIQVYNVNRWTDRTLVLRHYMVDSRELDNESSIEVMKHAASLWGFDVQLETVDKDGEVNVFPKIVKKQ